MDGATARRLQAGEVLSPDREIAGMIAEIEARHAANDKVARVPGEPHPADLILKSLNSSVEQKARASARLEIASIAKEIARKPSPVSGTTSHLKLVPASKPETNPVPKPSSNPFAPARQPTPNASEWIIDVFMAANAERQYNGGIHASMAPVSTLPAGTFSEQAKPVAPPAEEDTDHAAEAAIILPVNSVAAPSEVFAEPAIEATPETAVVEDPPQINSLWQPNPSPVLEASPDISTYERHVAAAQKRAARKREEDRAGWLIYGVPAVAMVSLIALAAAIETSDTIAVRAAPIAAPADDATASVPLASVDMAGEASDVVPAGEATVVERVPSFERTPRSELAPEAELAAPTVPAIQPEAEQPAENVTAVAATPEVTATPELSAASNDAPASVASAPAPVSASAATSTDVSSVEALVPVATAPVSEPLTGLRTISAPSVKPVSIAISALPAPPAEAVPAPAALVARPANKVPVRMFNGPIEVGSAAALVNEAAQVTGPPLSKTETFWLARDMQKVLESEIDGRSVILQSRQGQQVRVFLESSQQVEREYTLTRSAEMGALPHGLSLEGGWYAARKDVALSATPALGSEFRHRQLKQDMLIERMGTFTGRYGDRWYLMGQRGVAVGFVSAADVTPAGAHDRPLGLPYHQVQGDLARDERLVYTRCRDGFIGPEGGQTQVMSVCRNSAGQWITADQGRVTARTAGLFGSLAPVGGTASMIVLAKASGDDPVAYHAMTNRLFRRRFQGALTHARTGQVTRQVLPEGGAIKFTFGEAYEARESFPVLRNEAVGEIASGLKIDARWVTAPIGASLRAMPDDLVRGGLGNIPAGKAIEQMGTLVGRRGDDWALVGRNGVAFGYVKTASLTRLGGHKAPQAVSRVHTRKAADLVEAITPCRRVSYETIDQTGSFDACQQPDGNWMVKADLVPRFAENSAIYQAAP